MKRCLFSALLFFAMVAYVQVSTAAPAPVDCIVRCWMTKEFYACTGKTYVKYSEKTCTYCNQKLNDNCRSEYPEFPGRFCTVTDVRASVWLGTTGTMCPCLPTSNGVEAWMTGGYGSEIPGPVLWDCIEET